MLAFLGCGIIPPMADYKIRSAKRPALISFIADETARDDFAAICIDKIAAGHQRQQTQHTKHDYLEGLNASPDRLLDDIEAEFGSQGGKWQIRISFADPATGKIDNGKDRRRKFNFEPANAASSSPAKGADLAAGQLGSALAEQFGGMSLMLQSANQQHLNMLQRWIGENRQSDRDVTGTHIEYLTALHAKDIEILALRMELQGRTWLTPELAVNLAEKLLPAVVDSFAAGAQWVRSLTVAPPANGA